MGSDARLVSYHAGGRGLSAAFMLPKTFHADTLQVLFEADPGAVAEMRQPTDREQRALGPHAVYPYCLGEADGRGRLFVTADAFGSSNLEPDPRIYRFYAPLVDCDVAFAETLAVAKVLEVDIVALDGLFGAGRLGEAPPPDFFSLDTQGSELAILKGARNLVRDSVLGVASEVELLPVYKDQPLFPEVFSYLAAQGFMFCGFTSLQELALLRAPRDIRGRGIPGFGDVLFLRTPESVDAMARSPAHRALMLRKLAFIAICWGHFEYALHVLGLAGTSGDDLGEASYLRFLAEFRAIVQETSSDLPPVFRRPATAPGFTLKQRIASSDILAPAAYYLRDIARPFYRAWKSAPFVRT